VQSGSAIHLRKIDVGALTNQSLQRGGVASHDRVGNIATGGVYLGDNTE